MSHLVECAVIKHIELSLGGVENEDFSSIICCCPSVDEYVVKCDLVSGIIPVSEVVYSGIIPVSEVRVSPCRLCVFVLAGESPVGERGSVACSELVC